MYVVQFSGLLSKQFSTTYARNGNRLASSFRQYENYGRFCEYRKRVALWLKEQGGQIVEACARQFEFIAAQRVRRSLQIFHLYTRIWDDIALKEFMKTWRNRALKNSKHFLMSSIGVTMYNWDRERISEDELNSCKQEIEGIHKLKDSTVICAKCHLRIVIDAQQPGVKYCTCYGDKFNATSNEDPDGWRPYIERQDMLIWRKEEPNSGGLFAYKVYGTFSDVTAEDFLQTQIDVDYRKKWDPTARELQIIDTDPKSQKSVDDSTDIIYWETIWPRLFANRDYVYQRRWVVDKEKRLIIIINRVTEHPGAPTKPGIYRVNTYWSYMVIRPYTEFHQPGIEFGLTYFDDPGVNIPSAVTAWVAMAGLPDFLIRMRQASKNYKNYKLMRESENVSNTKRNISTRDEDISQRNIEKDKTERGKENETVNERNAKERDDLVEESEMFGFMETQEDSDESEEDDDDTNGTTTDSTDEGRGLLRYIFLTKLFV
ncbi:StAR-related lipid transfer protein 7, mitochondrial [Habropoda laboriosa]|uniref:Phosphatidylcholine transfer protein n=1 Tax=Habropoda laboriosa TaxID=597456 RepID=A0A0L7QKN1_9HYME|nr:PREDICTED: stAR-related lipid transfer protein 7, mitochondrial [Habropoda laboriosa]KOC59167.1 StAR-related lipid transfer protein 7, mitochondrial [Habropoda laboriosa]